jgi:hypothetical protein
MWMLSLGGLHAAPLNTITVTIPNTSTARIGGSTCFLAWTTNNGATGNVKIELLKDGSVDSTIAASVPADALAYDWTVPVLGTTISTGYTVRISDASDSNPTDTSDTTFTIRRPSLAVTAPNGSESLIQGVATNITWTTNLVSDNENDGGTLKIELLKAGSVVSTIATGVVASDGTYAWTVPSNQTVGSDYTIRLTHESISSLTDDGDAAFSVAAPSAIQVTSPNGGFAVDQKGSLSIAWSTSLSPAGNVKIELYQGGSSVYTISSSTSNDGSYSWSPASDFQSGSYRLRITSTSDPATYDESDSDIIIGDCFSKALIASATADAATPKMTLNWQAYSGATGYTIYRKTPTATSWPSPIGTAAASATSYADTTAAVGTLYEYAVSANGSSTAAYLYAGINLPLVENRGKLVLIVDSTQATALATEITRLIRDLTGDGWTVLRHDVAPTDTVASVKALIKADYDADTANVKAVFLLGHIPVPYSGDANPDGHPEHKGAWPADVYYGDMDGSWTDTTVNTTTADDSRNDNIPGDGKFDPSTVSTVELAVGRVDMNNLPIFSPMTETDLLRRYLDKDHKWRHKQATAEARMLFDDEFTDYATGAWRTGGVFFPMASLHNKDFMATLRTQSYQFAYCAGAGDQASASNAVDNTFYVNSAPQAVFQGMFGSYFADWDFKNNLLRSSIAGDGLGLTNCWNGRPNWYFHPMGMGETVGRGHLISQNNDGTIYTSGTSPQGIHMALMGDPALRLHILAPVTNLSLSGTTLTWTASADATLGYHVYRAASASGPFTRLTTNPITATTYTDSGGGSSYTYMVRAIALTTSNTGTYQNASQGVFTEAAPVATTIALSPLYPRVNIGTTQTFTASVRDQNGAPRSPQPAITWSTTSGSITSGGLFTPSASVGTATITATSGSVSTSTTVTVLPAVGSGTGISREFWSGITGATVANLTGAAAYPASPNSTSTLTDLCETPLGLGINFGQRLQGFFVPPVTGNYYFYINSNASSELWLSTDEAIANATKIASVSGYTFRQQWDKYSEQKSAAISLTAGQRVFYRVLHKAGDYGYYQVGVGVEYPGGVMERPIPAHRFDLMDNAAPTWTSGCPKADTVTSTSFTARAKTNENGKAYYVVVADGATAPTPAEVKAGTASGGGAAIKSGTLTLTANTEASASVTGLTAETNYDVYFVAEDRLPNLQSAVEKKDLFVTASVSLSLESPAKTSVTIPSGTGLVLDTTASGGVASITHAWSKVSGTGTVTFSPSDQSDTVATFSADGTYVIRLTSTDGTTTATQDVTVQVGGEADDVASGRVAWWKFDETSGTTAANSGTAGTAQNATLQSGTGVTWAAGKRGNAVTSDGTSYFRAANNLASGTTNTCTITLWVKANLSSAGGRGLFYDRSSSVQKGLHTNNGLLKIGDWNASNWTSAGTLTIPDNTWTFVAMTVSATQMKVWMRTDVASSFSSWTNPATSFTASQWQRPGIGGDQWNANLPGQLDDVRFYDRTLTETELTTIYTGGNRAPVVSAGSDLSTSPNTAFTLAGSASDDARPVSPGTTTVTWSKVSGPGAVTFGNAASANTTATADQAGTYVLRLTADDGEVKTCDDVTVTIATPFASWASGYSLTGEQASATADPDGDGLNNLLEYALGSTPDSSASRPNLASQISDSKLQITFTPQRSDVTYTIEASSDLTTWSPLTMPTLTVGQSTTVTDTVALGAGTKRFLRLKVSQ